MDIHRCRFVPYPPSTINALAFSHSHVSKNLKQVSPRLAVGRANGDIEIWNPLNESWLQETIIRGGQDRSVDGLVWIQDPDEEQSDGKTIVGKSRLFSIGYSTVVTEWDLARGRPLRIASGNHGEIWCLAAQPLPPPQTKDAKDRRGQWQGQTLIAGCTDGALVLYSTADEDLQFKKILVRPSAKKAKVISVAFQDRNTIIAGCTDSVIRVYDIGGGHLRVMSLGAGQRGGPKDIFVWSVKVLQNGNLISGDSTGEIRIWEGKTHTLMQRIKSHQADVLSLATSFDGSMIISGGMDRRTVVYKQVGQNARRWAEVSHKRYHTHDVKTMTSFEGNGMSVVVSGGPDAAPTVLPLQKFGREDHRALPTLPQQTAVQSSAKRRLLMSWWDREVHIWRLSKPRLSNNDFEPISKSRKLVAKILIQGEANITSASLTPDGNLVAVSTATEIKVFQLKPRKHEEGEGLKVSKVNVPAAFSSGARFIQFSPDGNWLCIIRDDSRVALARLVNSSTPSPIILSQLTKLSRTNRQIEKYVLLGGLGNYNRTITQASFSSDSRILVVSDLAGYLESWVLSGHEDPTQGVSHPRTSSHSSSSTSSSESDSDSDSENENKHLTLIHGQHWHRSPTSTLLPHLPSTPVILSFRPSSASHPPTSDDGPIPHATRHNPHPITHDLPTGEDRLLVITATSEIYEFSVLKGALTPWSCRNSTRYFPKEWLRERDLVRGVVWDLSRGRERAWVWSVGSVWMFDLGRDFDAPNDDVENVTNGEVQGKEGMKRDKKRKRRGKEPSTGAGSTIQDEELGTGISRKMQRTNKEGTLGESEDIHFHHSSGEDVDAMDLDEEDDDTADSSTSLSLLRRNELSNGNRENGQAEREEEEKPRSWHTYKYRPILGMVVIGETEEEEGYVGPEVAIVERPIWDADLPPRFYGDQEWEKSGV